MTRSLLLVGVTILAGCGSTFDQAATSPDADTRGLAGAAADVDRAGGSGRQHRLSAACRGRRAGQYALRQAQGCGRKLYGGQLGAKGDPV